MSGTRDGVLVMCVAGAASTVWCTCAMLTTPSTATAAQRQRQRAGRGRCTKKMIKTVHHRAFPRSSPASPAPPRLDPPGQPPGTVLRASGGARHARRHPPCGRERSLLHARRGAHLPEPPAIAPLRAALPSSPSPAKGHSKNSKNAFCESLTVGPFACVMRKSTSRLAVAREVPRESREGIVMRKCSSQCVSCDCVAGCVERWQYCVAVSCERCATCDD